MNLAIKYLPSIFLFHACACGSVKFETSWRCGKILCQLALVGKSGTRKYIIPIGTYNVCWSSDILVKLFNNLFYCFVFSAQIQECAVQKTIVAVDNHFQIYQHFVEKLAASTKHFKPIISASLVPFASSYGLFKINSVPLTSLYLCVTVPVPFT